MGAAILMFYFCRDLANVLHLSAFSLFRSYISKALQSLNLNHSLKCVSGNNLKQNVPECNHDTWLL